MAKHIDVTELILRDAHQSLMATRMSLEDMVPACADLDQAGFWSVECWGGATFDSCIRFLNEDPWERLRTFRKLIAEHAPAKCSLRGQNLLGYRHYEDHVAERFVEKAAENGMDVFRVFDALNDILATPRPQCPSGEEGRRSTPRAPSATPPARCIPRPSLSAMAQRLLDIGCESICIKDMAALLKPQPAYDIVKGIKAACGDVRIHVHVHSTTGVTLVSLMKAIEAGADCVDTAISSLSLGPGHNPTESLVEMLDGTGFTTNLSKQRLLNLKRYFNKVRPRYTEFLSNITGVETGDLRLADSRSTISNMESQLKQQGAGDRMHGSAGGSPPRPQGCWLPTAEHTSSQIVETQAVFNVLLGRYKTRPNSPTSCSATTATTGPGADPAPWSSRQPRRRRSSRSRFVPPTC